MEIAAVECAPPVQIQNGFVEATSNNTVFGTKVKYTCESGFKIIGPSVLTCLASGQYDAVPPSCIGKWKTRLLLTHLSGSLKNRNYINPLVSCLW